MVRHPWPGSFASPIEGAGYGVALGHFAGRLAPRAMVVCPCCRAGRARRQPGPDASQSLGILSNNQLEPERAKQCRQADRPKNPHRLRAQ